MTKTGLGVRHVDCSRPIKIDPGRGPVPPAVISRIGLTGSVGDRRLSALSSVFAMKAFTLTTRAAASRRTCIASRSSRVIVVRTIE